MAKTFRKKALYNAIWTKIIKNIFFRLFNPVFFVLLISMLEVGSSEAPQLVFETKNIILRSISVILYDLFLSRRFQVVIVFKIIYFEIIE